MGEVNAYMDAMQRVHRAHNHIMRRGASPYEYKIHVHPVLWERMVADAPWGWARWATECFGLPIVQDASLDPDGITLRHEVVA